MFKRYSSGIFLLSFLQFIFVYNAPAQDKALSYQGVLTNAQGDIVSDGTYSLRFALYETAAGGSAQWNETQSVQVANGVFNVYLGKTNPLTLAFNRQFWLGTSVNGGQEMTPRTMLATSPYAFTSHQTKSVDGIPAGGVLTGTYPNPALGAGSVSAQNIAAGATVKGLNGLRDNVRLVAGNNITINENGNDISISAITGGGGGLQLPDSLVAGTNAQRAALTIANSGQGAAITGRHLPNNNYGQLGTDDAGVNAAGRGNAVGLDASARDGAAVFAESKTWTGVVAEGGISGVSGTGNIGVEGWTWNADDVPNLGDAAVRGLSEDRTGVSGGSVQEDGVSGVTDAGDRAGVYAYNNSRKTEGSLASIDGAFGKRGDHEGFLGHEFGGAAGINLDSGNYGYIGNDLYAGEFVGDVAIEGDLFVDGVVNGTLKNFVIDHPLDPQNKLLYHASIESSEMLNLYSGNVVLDGNGEAAVKLPDYFQAANEDIRYQLTCIGGWAQVYIAEEVRENSFRIAGGKPGMKVSWQVTGARSDAWAKAHPMAVEVEKNAGDRGKYLTPAAFGADASRAIGFERRLRATQSVRESNREPVRYDAKREGKHAQQ